MQAIPEQSQALTTSRLERETEAYSVFVWRCFVGRTIPQDEVTPGQRMLPSRAQPQRIFLDRDSQATPLLVPLAFPLVLLVILSSLHFSIF